MRILSHRGYWKVAGEKNTLAAFERSFRLGFGTETDVRDHNGRLVIAHDPPTGEPINFDTFLETYRNANIDQPLALNIKADGLQAMLQAALQQYGIFNYFLFDMSVPDMVVSLRHRLRVYTRHSDVEPLPTLYETAAGVWMDAFQTEWISEQGILEHLQTGKEVCVVSPELHGRNEAGLWHKLKTIPASVSQNLMLCTDKPEAALEYFHV